MDKDITPHLQSDPNEDSFDPIENEGDCFISDEVTYLKDAYKEPSLNTLIQQDLEQGQAFSGNASVDNYALRLQSPSNDNNQSALFSGKDMMSSFAEDPLLCKATANSLTTENSRDLKSNCDAKGPIKNAPRRSSRSKSRQANKTPQKREYSPEIVCNPIRKKKKRKVTSTVTSSVNIATMKQPKSPVMLLNSTTCSAPTTSGPSLDIVASQKNTQQLSNNDSQSTLATLEQVKSQDLPPDDATSSTLKFTTSVPALDSIASQEILPNDVTCSVPTKSDSALSVVARHVVASQTNTKELTNSDSQSTIAILEQIKSQEVLPNDDTCSAPTTSGPVLDIIVASQKNAQDLSNNDSQSILATLEQVTSQDLPPDDATSSTLITTSAPALDAIPFQEILPNDAICSVPTTSGPVLDIVASQKNTQELFNNDSQSTLATLEQVKSQDLSPDDATSSTFTTSAPALDAIASQEILPNDATCSLPTKSSALGVVARYVVASQTNTKELSDSDSQSTIAIMEQIKSQEVLPNDYTCSAPTTSGPSIDIVASQKNTQELSNNDSQSILATLEQVKIQDLPLDDATSSTLTTSAPALDAIASCSAPITSGPVLDIVTSQTNSQSTLAALEQNKSPLKLPDNVPCSTPIKIGPTLGNTSSPTINTLQLANNDSPKTQECCITVSSSSVIRPILNEEIDEERFPEDIDPYDGDFSPDDDDSDYQPPVDDQNLSHTSCESVPTEVVGEKRKRAKRGQAKKECWQNEVHKNKRMKGENYKGRRTTEDGKIVFDVEKQERSLKTRCDHDDNCKYFECYKLTDDIRKQIFDRYWRQSWETKRVWIQKTVLKKGVATRKCHSNSNRRQFTYKYHLHVSGTQFKVCKKMYLNTLDIGEWSVHNWTKDEMPLPNENQKSKKRNSNIKAIEDFGKYYAREFLNALPKLESHYCRKNTSKLYLEPNWQSLASLYREYINYLTNSGKIQFKISLKLFASEFDALNLSLFTPKKDQCDLCCAYNVGNVLEEEYDAHISKKNSARDEKTKDKDLNDETTKVFTFDLQAVLLAPALKASALYYKTKLKVHNFTIYDLKTKEAFCFVWNESEGGVNADEFASILHYFVGKYVSNDVLHIIFWSDGCTNQNRNAILANALLQLAVQRSITITHKYLEKGHTQMECDSMHSTIERKLKNREIYSPGQYVEVCKTARLEKPYIVEYLDHGFFKQFSSFPYLNSIRPGKKVGDATVFDIRCIEYRSNGKIYIKKSFDETEEFEELPRRIKKPSISDTIPMLYEARIPILKSKYIHLQELKSVLPSDVHAFYDELPHLCTDDRRNPNTSCSCRKSVV